MAKHNLTGGAKQHDAHALALRRRRSKLLRTGAALEREGERLLRQESDPDVEARARRWTDYYFRCFGPCSTCSPPHRRPDAECRDQKLLARVEWALSNHRLGGMLLVALMKPFPSRGRRPGTKGIRQVNRKPPKPLSDREEGLLGRFLSEYERARRRLPGLPEHEYCAIARGGTRQTENCSARELRNVLKKAKRRNRLAS